ncbi:coiled-coil domain-containing protein 112 isoform X1 [Triplophysa rosa]|uniref:coiled-coil domain-containing protein 112 isoform X1 n=1 Tax=Triplophysa rosa TaxID=992332 RepID=UPI0025462B94|nr:coiled-coil domain-containing protein 112 isoform X1 [Triplophysa rosa]
MIIIDYFLAGFYLIFSVSCVISHARAQMSVTDFLREADRLRKLEIKHERETSRRFHARKHFSVLEEIHVNDELGADSKICLMKVQEELQKIRNCVYSFQAQLTDVKPSPDLIDRIKDTMTDIENSIKMFKDKQHQRFEELLKEEKIFWQEIGAFEQKIDVWSLPVKADGGVPRSAGICADVKDSRNLPTEVMALETFLQQSGGLHGCWDKYDHQNFMKVWTKHNGKPSYRKEAKLYLPDKTVEDIRLHEEWYLELCHLQEEKREAIHKWRAGKQREHELQREQREKEALRKEPDEAAADLRLKQEEQRREASEQLETWRSCRKQQLEREQEQRVRHQIQRRKRAKEERRRQLELKLMVESRVQQKKKEEELHVLQKEAQLQAEREERRRLAAEDIKRFQQRDSHRLEIKLQEKQNKEQEEHERQRNLDKLKEKVQIHIARDPTRLWKATKGWEEHIKEIGPSGGGPVSHMFHRAVPTWRQDL